MFAGELDMTNLKSGEVIANRITKANCSRESGWIPANGLVYTTPKHCTCWPMLRGFVAMAPAATKEQSPANLPPDQIDFLLEKGPAEPDPTCGRSADRTTGRCIVMIAGEAAARHGRTETRWTDAGAASLQAEDRNAEAKVSGPILHDWKENPVVKGPLSAPTIAGGIAYVTRPNAHELIAIDTSSGEVRWRFTANGRLDTPPAIHRGLCLFGSAAGWVYALRADNGELVWRLRAAPTDERIVAYGQVESPWPVPGAVLVMDDIAYFAAGRQPLADGGILVFAVDPMTGERHWVQRIDSVPQKGFYENSGLEFDPFDILHAEGDGLAMSRWIILARRKGGRRRQMERLRQAEHRRRRSLDSAGRLDLWRAAPTSFSRRGAAATADCVSRRQRLQFARTAAPTSFAANSTSKKVKKFNSKWITGWEACKTATRRRKAVSQPPHRQERAVDQRSVCRSGGRAPEEPEVRNAASQRDPRHGTWRATKNCTSFTATAD